MLIPATRKVAIFSICVAIAISSFYCEAEREHSTVDICHLLKNRKNFDGKTVELNSDVEFTMHGRYLFGASCHELGSIGLSIDEKKYDDGKVIRFVKAVMKKKGRAHVILVGRFTDVSSENVLGSFALKDIVEVDNRAGIPMR